MFWNLVVLGVDLTISILQNVSMAQVALLVETALSSGRDILKGISQYVHEHEDWQVFHYTGSLGVMVPEVLAHWDGDGIIARVNQKEMLQVIRQKQVPVVDVLGNVRDSGFHCVKSDNEKISNLVFDHFYERGFKSYGFLGVEGEAWSEEREFAFSGRVVGASCAYSAKKVSHFLKQHSSWNTYLAQLASWLSDLPKPVAIFVCSDQFAPDLTSACAAAKLRIPDDVAIVGVDNDPAFCEVVRPSLSSVDANHVQIGYTAASLLGDMLAGRRQVHQEIRSAPNGIVTRQSSDAFALDDEGLKKAMSAIRTHACEGIGVDEIAKVAGYSRSVLQRRFRSMLGRTVHDAVLSTKLDRAKELLTLTRLSLIEVSLRSGFNHQEYLNHVFKARLGMTPGEYRKQFAKK